MMDLDHPRTPLVFAASVQLDLILGYAKKMTLSGAAGRRFMAEVIRPAFAALRWLNAARFAAAPRIAAGLDELERGVDALADMPLADPDHRGGPAPRCPACGEEPTAAGPYNAAAYCSRCLEAIMPGLVRVRSCEEGFGTESI